MMLVLTRKLGEKISIAGGEIELHVIEVSGSRVRLGITAPQEYRISRAEQMSGDSDPRGLNSFSTLAVSGR
jgi:carbon storage regulator